VLFALSAVADRILVGTQKVDPRIVLFVQHCVYLLFFATVLVFRRVPIRSLIGGFQGMSGPLLLIALFTIGYRFAQLEATSVAPAALVLAVKRSSILFATLFGGRLFADDRLRSRLIGAALIVAAGFAILRNVG
jgi:uncharacterized membrane protein